MTTTRQAALESVLRRVMADPLWRTNDNTLWPDMTAALATPPTTQGYVEGDHSLRPDLQGVVDTIRAQAGKETDRLAGLLRVLASDTTDHDDAMVICDCADLIEADFSSDALAELKSRQDGTEISLLGVWPNFIAPQKYEDADPRWKDPVLPNFRLIWKIARLAGYAVGLHGSMKRDCDMIAAPWVPEAIPAAELIDKLCQGLNARVVGSVEEKPFGRQAWNLQIDGYVKVIDISVMPLTSRPAPQPAADTRVVVKPLVWPKDANHNGIYNTAYNGTGLCYTIKLHAPNRVIWCCNQIIGWCDADSEAAAQAACQADFDGRIRAIIGNATPAPSDKIAEAARVPEVARVVEAYKRLLKDLTDHGGYTYEDDFVDDLSALSALAGQGETP